MENNETNPIGKGLYLCCFFKGTTGPCSEIGIDGINSTFTMRYQDIGALISPVPLNEFGNQVINRNVNDLKWLTPKVRRHEEITRQVMEKFPVIPVKFGTIYTEPKKILNVMKNSYTEFTSYFDFVYDKEEWGVKVFVHKKKYLKKAENALDSNGVMNPQNGATTPGKNYFLRKKMEASIQQEIDVVMGKLSQKFHQTLSPIAAQSKKNKLLSNDATGIIEDMILNSAYLVEKSKVVHFKNIIRSLADEYEPEIISFRISGPWPPYNFCPEKKIFEEE